MFNFSVGCRSSSPDGGLWCYGWCRRLSPPSHSHDGTPWLLPNEPLCHPPDTSDCHLWCDGYTHATPSQHVITCHTGVEVHLKGILDLESHHQGAWRRIIFWGEPLDGSTHQLHPSTTQHQAPAVKQPGSAAASSTSNSTGISQREGGAAAVPHCGSPTCTHGDTMNTRRRRRVQPCCCCPKTLPDFESAGACWVHADEVWALPLRSEAEPHRWFPAMAAGGRAAREQPLYGILALPPEWQAVFAGFPVG